MVAVSVLALVLGQTAPQRTRAEAEALVRKAIAAWEDVVPDHARRYKSVDLKNGDVKEAFVQGRTTFSNNAWTVAFDEYASSIEFHVYSKNTSSPSLPIQKLDNIGRAIISGFVGKRVKIEIKEAPSSYKELSTITYSCQYSYLGLPVQWESSKLTLERSSGFPVKIVFPSYLHYLQFPRASDPYFKRVMSIDKLDDECERVFLATGPFAESTSRNGHVVWRRSDESELRGSVSVQFLNKIPAEAKLIYEKEFQAELKNGEDNRYISIDAVSGKLVQYYDLMASMVIKIGYRDSDLSEIKAGTEFRVIGPRRQIIRNILSIEKANNDETGKTVLVKLSNGRYYKCRYLGLGKFLIKGNLVVTDIKTWEIDGLLAEPLIKVQGIVQ